MSVIDEYLAGLSLSDREQLQRIREIVQNYVPDATEAISYGMPAFKYKSKYLMGYSAFKDHLSIFPASTAIDTLKERLVEYKTSKGTIQFTKEKPLPESLVIDIVSIRKNEIDSSHKH